MAGKGRKVKQISKKKIRRRRTQGKFSSKRITGTRFYSHGLHHRRVAGAVPCGELSLAGDFSLTGKFSLAEERSLAGESSLGGVVEADDMPGAASERSW